MEPLKEEPIVLATQSIVEETLLSSTKKTKQSIQFGLLATESEELSIGINIPKLITLESTFNVFGTLDWVTKEGWPLIPKQIINDNLVTETYSNSGETAEWNLFKLFIQNTNFVKTNIRPNVHITLTMLIGIPTMNVPSFMVVAPINVLRIKLPKYHNNENLVLHIWQLTKECVTNGEESDAHKI